MFHAVREWWADGRGRSAARLFIFEFFVVLSGASAALFLANWNERRAAFAAMEEAREKADRDVAFHHAAALGWKKAIPCLDERMTLLMQKLATGEPVDSDLLRRPAMETGHFQLPSEENRQLLTERYGVDRAQDYWAESQNVTHLSDNVVNIIESWSGFAMVDPINGPVDAQDRHEARLAASSVKSALRGLDIVVGNIIGRAEALGIKPDSQGESRAIQNCDDLWRNGMTHPDAEME